VIDSRLNLLLGVLEDKNLATDFALGNATAVLAYTLEVAPELAVADATFAKLLECLSRLIEAGGADYVPVAMAFARDAARERLKSLAVGELDPVVVTAAFRLGVQVRVSADFDGSNDGGDDDVRGTIAGPVSYMESLLGTPAMSLRLSSVSGQPTESLGISVMDLARYNPGTSNSTQAMVDIVSLSADGLISAVEVIRIRTRSLTLTLIFTLTLILTLTLTP